MRLLVSVRDAREAEAAIGAGADLVDLKDPGAGSLGALAPAAIRAILEVVAGRRPVSAVTGDLAPEPARLRAAAGRIAATGVDFVKVGLWPGPRRAEAVSRLGAEFAGRTRLIGVLLADADPDPGLLPLMAAAGFAGAMLDCAHKGERLPERLGPARLAGFVDAARGHGLTAGLAGSLALADIARLAPIRPDILGFRGGLCVAGERTGALDPAAVRRAAEAVEAARRAGAAPAPAH